ncbi:unnamed protein product, partial [Allacma fusca]
EELLEPQGRSIGVNAKLSIGPDKRTRIDNLGGYHEYKSYPGNASLVLYQNYAQIDPLCYGD